MDRSLLLRDLRLIPMDGPPDAPLGDVCVGSLRIRGDRIAALGELAPKAGDEVVDCAGLTAMPGFVQGHVHFCQTLFRGLADDLPLLPWLRERIWPLEAAHDERSARASADLSLAELLATGTTTVQVMESVHHADQACEAVLATPITAILGNALMDQGGDGVPARLVTSRAEGLALTDDLRRRYHGRQGRIHTAVSPRFVLSCSDELARDAAAFAREHGLRIHTHAAEHPDEVATVRRIWGRDYLAVLERQGLLGARTTLAHCVHTSALERAMLRDTGTGVLHCPSTNLKLGSGIAPIAAYRAMGIPVALGADGAPCNNRLSALQELRQAALLQALAAGPGAWPAQQALWTATRGGAEALGLQDELGCLRPGLRADLVLLDLGAPDVDPGGDEAARICYSAHESHIVHVLCGGTFAVRDRSLLVLDHAEVAARARECLPSLLHRAGLAR